MSSLDDIVECSVLLSTLRDDSLLYSAGDKLSHSHLLTLGRVILMYMGFILMLMLMLIMYELFNRKEDMSSPMQWCLQ